MNWNSISRKSFVFLIFVLVFWFVWNQLSSFSFGPGSIFLDLAVVCVFISSFFFYAQKFDKFKRLAIAALLLFAVCLILEYVDYMISLSRAKIGRAHV